MLPKFNSVSHIRSAITSLEWHKEDSTVFASSGADDQVGDEINGRYGTGYCLGCNPFTVIG